MRLLVAALVPLISGVAHAADFHGPVPMKNHHPFYTGLLLPPPEAAAPVDARRWEVSFDYSNVYLYGTDKRWSVGHDYEIAELSMTLRQPVMDGAVEIGGRAPLFYQYAGFMDGMLRAWHKLLGVRGYSGQAEAPDYRYEQRASYEGEVLIRGREREVVAGDVTLWVKGRLWEEGERLVSGSVYLQLPTGDVELGVGSGDYEYGARLVGSTVAEGIGVTWGIGVTGPSRFEGIETGVSYQSMVTLFIATEWPLQWLLPVEDWTLVVQSMGNTSPVAGETSIYQYGQGNYDLTIGLRHAPAGGPVWSVALSENLNRTNPDFTVNVAVGW